MMNAENKNHENYKQVAENFKTLQQMQTDNQGIPLSNEYYLEFLGEYDHYSQETLLTNISKIKSGANSIYNQDIDTINQFSMDALENSTNEIISDEDKKQWLISIAKIFMEDHNQNFDEFYDKLNLSKENLEKLSIHELEELISEQIAETSLNMSKSVLEETQTISEEDFKLWSEIELNSKEDSIMLGVAMYKASLDGDISVQYQSMPELLGAIASSQYKISQFCANMIVEGEDEKVVANKIAEYTISIFQGLLLFVLGVVAYALFVMGIVFGVNLLTAFLALPVVSLILDLFLKVAVGVVVVGALTAVVVGFTKALNYVIKEKISPKHPKIKKIYGDLYTKVTGENPFEFDEYKTLEDEDEDENADENEEKINPNINFTYEDETEFA